MNDIFSYYTKYSEHINEYNNWSKQQLSNGVKSRADIDNQILKDKAKAIADPILLLDSYEHDKAEDSESFFLTYNIELMSVATLLASLPVAVTKLIPFLNKNSSEGSFLGNVSKALSRYKNASVNMAGKNLSVSKLMSAAGLIGCAVFYAKGIKKSMQSQLGLIRKASFDATQNIIDNPKIFAALSDEQNKQLNDKLSFSEKNKSAFVDKLKDRVNINSSIRSVNEYRMNKNSYEKKKKEYFDNIMQNANCKVSDKKSAEAISDKVLLQSYLKNVEHAVLEPLRRVETIANISYSSLFTGGFLEYLISDKLVDVLGVKNKLLRAVMKIGVPLLTYFVLNKNISNIENKAILATKYKYLKGFTENPSEGYKPEQNQSLPEFIKTVYKDMKDYEKFEQNELPLLREKLDIKKNIKLSDKQFNDAVRLQKNTSMAINTQREKLYEQSVGIKALSETLLGPLDIIATAVGGKIGHNMSKKIQNKKLAGLMTGLGAVMAFIPAAIVEAKLTKQQKLSEKIASMLAVKELQNDKLFADNLQQVNTTFSEDDFYKSDVFKDITAKFL